MPFIFGILEKEDNRLFDKEADQFLIFYINKIDGSNNIMLQQVRTVHNKHTTAGADKSNCKNLVWGSRYCYW